MTSHSKRLLFSACLGLLLGVLVTLLMKKRGMRGTGGPVEEPEWRELTDEELLA